MLTPQMWYRPSLSVAQSAVRVREPRRSLRIGFGRAVRRLRLAAGYSEEQFGARAGLHPVDVITLEMGEQNVSLSLAERVAGALNLPVSSLLREAERES